MAGAIQSLSVPNSDTSRIPFLSGDNFNEWKEKILLTLGCNDLDLAFRVDEPPAHVGKSIRGSIPDCEKFTGTKGVREHIMEMRDIAARLKSLEIEISESFLVHFILNSLPQDYGPFKISYNTHKEKWSINELLTLCVQEEGRLNQERMESAHTVTTGKKFDKKGKGKSKAPLNQVNKNAIKCFFCKNKGHMTKVCPKYMKWLEKKGNLISLVCYESNMVHVSHNTWWIDSGSTIHISNTMQGFLNHRKPMESERAIYSGNKMPSRVEAVRTYRLVLNSGFVLDLDKTFYIPSFSRNLVSVSRLLPFGFCFNFLGIIFHLLKDSVIVGDGILDDSMFKLHLNPTFDFNLMTMHGNIGVKRSALNEQSSMLWHRRLGHISIERIKRLVNDRALEALDFTDFGTCVECIKGKQTNKTKKGARRSSDILEIVHTDICGPFSKVCLNGQRYFISFIDDYSRYMYLYLLYDKGEALDAFKVYKAEVEKQLGKPIKIVRSDRGGEYYGRYTGSGQKPGPFARFLEENERSKGYRFYCPSHAFKIVEAKNVRFIENDGINGSSQPRNIVFEEDQSSKTTPDTSDYLVVVQQFPQPATEGPHYEENVPKDLAIQQPPQEDVDIALRRSTRTKKPAIPSDYVVYLQESDVNIGAEDDPTSFLQATCSSKSILWYNAMKDEMDSMTNNQV
ncbi:hypothetical protein WN943_023248 [Citrus x changshan-huyou]